MFDTHSALAGHLKPGARDAAHGEKRLRLTEVRGWHLAQIAAFPNHHREFADRVRACSGVELPVDLYRGVTQGDSRLIRITAHQYWWLAAGGDSLLRLAQELPASAGTVTVLSASRVRIRISGSAARDLLAAGIALDLHPEVFRVGHSALTGLHHTGVFLERVGDDHYEVYVQRTYAEWLWDWLVDAALPFGYEVAVEERAAT
jgi:heterotetrameric sarcosine oxidase gamma subunit